MALISISTLDAIPGPVKAGAIGSAVMTLVVRTQYDKLFVFSPLATTILDEPLPLIVSSFFVGSVLMTLLSRRSDKRLWIYDAFVLAVSVAFLPAVVVFSFVVRVGIVTGFGPTITVESFGHFVVGMFFVLLYAGFGAILAGLIFTLVFVGSGIGAVLTVVLVRKFVDS